MGVDADACVLMHTWYAFDMFVHAAAPVVL